MFKTSYMIATLFLVIAYIAFFLSFRRGRRTMFWTGLLYCSAGPVSEFWSLRDYWQPGYLVPIRLGAWRFGLEDILLGWALAGLCAGLFEKAVSRKGGPAFLPVRPATFLFMLDWAFAGLIVMAVLIELAGMNSVHALLLSVSAVTAAMLSRRIRYVAPAGGLSLAFGFAYWVFYLVFEHLLFPGSIAAMWNFENTWGFNIAGVPFEEILWAAVTMLFCGPAFRIASELAANRRRTIRDGSRPGGRC